MVCLLVAAFSMTALAKTPQELVAELGKGLKSMSTMELFMEMEFGEEFIIIDVRDEGEHAGGRIPGAINVNFGKLFFTIANLIPDKSTTFIVSCAIGARSTIATYLLYELGYTNAIDLTGGFRDWMNSGYPVETMHGLFTKN